MEEDVCCRRQGASVWAGVLADSSAPAVPHLIDFTLTVFVVGGGVVSSTEETAAAISTLSSALTLGVVAGLAAGFGGSEPRWAPRSETIRSVAMLSGLG